MDNAIRERLVEFLIGHQAHMTFDEAVADFSQKFLNTKAPNVDYTFWHLIEHLRITQADTLDFCINPNYKEIKWPDSYWPDRSAKASKKDWEKSISNYDKDLKKIIKLVKDPKTDLNKKIAWGNGQTILREILLVIDHNSYHIGELGILRQLMKTWPKNHK